FQVKLTNEEVGRTVIFYVLSEENPDNYKVKYSSGVIPAESNGVNTFSPNFGTVSILENDVIGVYVNSVDTSNSIRLRDSGGSAISNSIHVSSDLSLNQTTSGVAESSTRRYCISAIIVPKDLLVSRSWGNKPNGFVKLDEEGYVPNRINR